MKKAIKTLLTKEFYRSLFIFSLIILGAFGMLFFLSSQNMLDPVEITEPETQLAQ